MLKLTPVPHQTHFTRSRHSMRSVYRLHTSRLLTHIVLNALQSEAALSREAIGFWTSFISSGNPATHSLTTSPEFLPFSSGRRMVLEQECHRLVNRTSTNDMTTKKQQTRPIISHRRPHCTACHCGSPRMIWGYHILMISTRPIKGSIV